MLDPGMATFGAPFSLGYSIHAARAAEPRVLAVAAVVASALQVVGIAFVAVVLMLEVVNRVWH